MSTACAFLSEVKIFIEVDAAVWAGPHALPAPGALFWIDYYQSVGPLIDAAFDRAGGNTGSGVAVHANSSDIGYFNLGYSPSDVFIHLAPELPGIRLRPGIGRPIIPAMLIFTGDLAVPASNTFLNIYHENFHLIPSLHPGIKA
jgi:hypothetical protein